MPPPDAWQFEAIGTAWQIDTASPLTPETRDAITARIESFDAAWSRFRDDSLVSQIARSGGTWELPDEADKLLRLYAELYEITDGAVTPLIGRALADLGYDANYSLTEQADPAPVPSWDAIAWHRPFLTNLSPVLLDVGAAGKGLLVDLLGDVLEGAGVDSYTVDGSGDMLHRSDKALRIALEHPADTSRAIGVAELAAGQALCASATNRRAWGDGLHHVLDGRTGRPTGDIIATWVIADSCMLADGLATALFLAEPAQLMPRFTYEFVRMHADGRVEWSPEFPGEVFA
ncbi:thiamine biosynthesis lipoprotein [Aeromicrobium panaciterrae]|uniref:FAD:protein FMN transferase n=1 Tax=Aeromicrobium panaciterrae TaxID=363861 RepID=A0ABU1UIZ8_9ACTN|nr:FAD:protein FMN transferase [Aeromicrobium panaciterrae]MDR7085167.1 thiamine biosynthesis lipoprotein [Aeromicrobium panaciterrae]